MWEVINMNEKHFIDLVYESKEEFDKIKIPNYKINHDKIRESLSEINELDCYLPLIILWKADPHYVDKANPEARRLMGTAYKLYRYLADGSPKQQDWSSELLIKDLYVWIEEHPEYKDFITVDG